MGAPTGFLESPLLFTNHATFNSNTEPTDPSGEAFLTFSVITTTVGPPTDPTIGVNHETVVRLVMGKRMAMALRDLLVRNVLAESEDEDKGESESGTMEADAD